MSLRGEGTARRSDLWLALGITLLAAALRFPGLAQHPPGFYHDEAFNGLDALRILAGERPIFFESNGGREAGFVYFVALSVAVLGRSPAAVRLVSAVMGTLTVPATFLLGRAMYGRRVGALAATVLAIMVVPIHLSRIGFRVVSVPFALGWFLWQLVRAWQTGRRWQWALAGLLYGLTFHTYTASRITPFALLAVALYVLVKGERRRLWPGGLWFALGAALTFAPLGLYALNHPQAYFTRTAQTASLGSDLVRQVVDTAGMFFVRGDSYPRHNVPGRPFFDPLLAIGFLLGLVVMWRERRRTRAVFVVVWLAVTSLATLLSVDPPHFLRTTPMFPMLAIPPALGLDWLWDWTAKRAGRRWAAPVVGGSLALSLALSVGAYFSPGYRLSESTYYQMDTPAVEMALDANRFLGTGWQGHGWRADDSLPQDGRWVMMPEALWNFSETTRYLVPRQPRGGAALSLIESPGDVPREVGNGFLLMLPPGTQGDYAAALPEGGVIAAHWGPTARADLETGEAPFVVYVAYEVTPRVGLPSEPDAEFEVGMALLDHQITVADGVATVRTWWRSERAIGTAYTLFVHVLSGDRVVGQMDGPLAEGLFPTDWWRPGDVVLDERVIALEPGTDPEGISVNVGFYLPENGERVVLVGGGDVVTLGGD